MAFREQMIALQREVFQKNQARINGSVFGYTGAYKRYEREYQAATKTYQAVSSFDDLVKAVSSADLVYIGDYHTLAQAQRTVVRLLRRLDTSPTLAVEFVEGRHQAALDAYMAGRLDDAAFLKRIHHDPQGVFGAWQHFKPMFDIAREKRLPMVGIDSVHSHSSTSLKDRDTYAARIIADAVRTRPGHPVIVHIGELHVSQTHLPKLVDAQLKDRKLKRVIIYQNCEEIYWKLENKKLEHEVEVVRVRGGEYCVITTPPIVCQQSYLNWLDAADTGDDELFENDSAPEKIFKSFVEMIASALAIPVRDAVDNVVVSSVVDVHFFETLRRRAKLKPKELTQVKKQILSSESYFIPQANMVYLGKLSINHAAEEASHFLKHICGGDDEPRYLVDAFYSRVMNEALGFLGSKIINHKRKCPHFADFQRLQTDDPFTKKLADYMLRHRAMEKGHGARGMKHVYASDIDMFNAVTHALGYIMGDKLYYAMVQGILHKDVVRGLFYDRFEEEGAALATYLSLVPRLSKVKLPKRSM